MSVERQPDHDLISRAIGLLTLELAFLVIFIYGELPPKDFGDANRRPVTT
jgi:hypothetical protein